MAKCFTVNGPLCYCNDINELFIKLFQTHVASDWRLFIDSSQRSLKAVLLHNGNEKPCIPIAHYVHFKETYANMDILLDTIQYNVHQSNLCGDLNSPMFDLCSLFTTYRNSIISTQQSPSLFNQAFLHSLKIRSIGV